MEIIETRQGRLQVIERTRREDGEKIVVGYLIDSNFPHLESYVLESEVL